MKKFEVDEHYMDSVKLVGQNDEGLIINTTHWHKEDEEQVYSIVTLDTGCMHIHCRITLAEARQLAANLLKLADEVEAHNAQLAESLQPA